MIEDMTIRKLAPKTQASYIRAVRNFTVFFTRSPDQARAEDLRRYQLHLASSGVSVPSLNATVTALRFFFTVTLGRREVTASNALPSRAAQASRGLEPGASLLPSNPHRPSTPHHRA